jgi:hypothetical protein
VLAIRLSKVCLRLYQSLIPNGHPRREVAANANIFDLIYKGDGGIRIGPRWQVGRRDQMNEASQSTISRLENAPSKPEAARARRGLLDQFGTTVKPGRLEILDIDDTFCAADGGQQLAFWNAQRARLCVDAHLSRDEQHAGCDHPALGAHPERHLQAAALGARFEVQAHAVADLDARVTQIDAAIAEATKRGKTTAAMALVEARRQSRAGLGASGNGKPVHWRASGRNAPP